MSAGQVMGDLVDAVAALILPQSPFPLAFALRAAVELGLEACHLSERPIALGADIGETFLEDVDPAAERLTLLFEFPARGLELHGVLIPLGANRDQILCGPLEPIDLGHALEELGLEDFESRYKPAVLASSRFELFRDAFRPLEALLQSDNLILEPLDFRSWSRPARLRRSLLRFDRGEQGIDDRSGCK